MGQREADREGALYPAGWNSEDGTLGGGQESEVAGEGERRQPEASWLGLVLITRFEIAIRETQLI
jgi:hypothetical protein